jgi:SAM-dependent methyltransferase
MPGPDPQFWQDRFERHNTPWDRGAASPQLERWLADGSLQAAAAHARIAVPGCGAGHEVAALAAGGYDVVALDYTPAAIALTRARLAAARLLAEVVQADVLAWLPHTPLAAVYEQTCLCALHPDHWRTYAERLHAWLRPGGQLFALFMQMPREAAAQGEIVGPPYHCDINAMRALFPHPLWHWPKPPYAQVPHAAGMRELAVVLRRQ